MKPASQTSIAKELGISQRTVSRALSGKGYVRQALKEKIIETAANVGYRKNPLARALLDGKTGVIGLLLHPIDNLYDMQLLNGLESNLSKRGYNALLNYHSPQSQDDHQAISQLFNYQVEGFICMPQLVGNWEQSIYAQLVKQHQQIVFLHQEPCFPEIGSVLVDDFKSTYAMTKYLIENGHQNIVYVTDSKPEEKLSTLNQSRKSGFIRAIQEVDLSLKYCDYYDKLTGITTQNIAETLREFPEVTAFCCSTDMVALDVIYTMNELNFKVPWHYSVTGIGNEVQAEINKLLSPALTTIDLNPANVAESAVNLLLKMIKGGNAETQTVPAKFIKRNSVRSI